MKSKFVYTLFEWQAIDHPQRIVIAQGRSEISYGQLQGRINDLSTLLCSLKLPVGSIVGVLGGLVSDQVTAMLSLFKSGYIFMPIDRSFAPARMKYVFETCTPRCIISSASERASCVQLLQLYGHENDILILINSELEAIHMEVQRYSSGELLPIGVDTQQTIPPPFIEPEEGCYIYFTSGSSGVPKAILGKHVSLAHFIQWEIEEFSISSYDVFSQLVPFTFDAFLRDVFVPLCSGATLAVPSAEQRENSIQLLHYLEEQRVTTIHTVPSFFRLLVSDAGQDNTKKLDLPFLKRILLSGEPLYWNDIKKWREVSTNKAEFVNLYGPSETTMIKTFHRVKEDNYLPGVAIHVGKPISDTIVAILDSSLNVCSTGEVGEVYIKTPFMTKGYFNDQARTDEVFIQNPFVKDRKEVIYKTGDLGRYLADQSIEILGRIDQQVKVNGVRIELGEVESSIRRLRDIEQVIVLGRPQKDGGIKLCCYYTGQKKDVKELIEELAIDLNANMIPSYFIHLDKFPVTMSGKIDRKALPIPDEMLNTHYVPPANEMESALEKLWGEVLGHKRVSRNASFFEIGGNSLQAIQLNSRIFRTLHVNLKLSTILRTSTIAGQAELITNLNREKIQPISRAPITTDFPLSHGQKRLWILSQFKENRVAYSIVKTYRLTGLLNATALQQSFHALIRTNESLRTVFRIRSGEPRQVILGENEHGFKLQLIESDIALLEIIQQQAYNEPFDLSEGPLLRAIVLKVDVDQHVLMISVHHIVSDGWSTEVMLKELMVHYNGFTMRQSYQPTEKGLQYKDYAHWQGEQVNNGLYSQQKAFWLNQFKGEIPLLTFPSELPRPDVKTFNGAELVHPFSQETLDRLRDQASIHGVSVFMYLMCSVQVLLYKYSGQDDLIVGTTVSGREHADLDDQIGFYVNVLPIRTSVFPEQSFKEQLSRVKQIMIDAYDHQQYPFDSLITDLDIKRDMGRAPLFDVTVELVDLASRAQEDTQLVGLQVEQLETGFTSSKYDLSFRFMGTSEMRLVVEYNPDVLEQTAITTMIDRYVRMLDIFLENPNCQISTLNILTNDELHKIQENCSGDKNEMSTQTVVDLFHGASKNFEKKVAVTFKETRLTYGELDACSDALASYLIGKCNAKPGAHIAIIMKHTIWLPVAVIAALRSGLTFVPIDPSYPTERALEILSDAEVTLVLADTDTLISRVLSIPVIRIEYSWSDIVNQKCALQLPSPKDIAYILYTSGTTGKPKGVMVSHGSLCHYVQWSNQYYFSNGGGEKFGWFTSLSFDLSITGLLGTLCRGHELLIYSHEFPGEALQQIFGSGGATTTKLTPSHLRLAEKIVLTKSNNLRCLIVGGEALEKSHLLIAEELSPSVEIYNEYGPTEATVGCTVAHVSSHSTITIGRPISNCSIYLLNQDDQNQLPGLRGEIAIVGRCLSEGYWNQPDETKRKFITLPSGERLYKTGDIGSWSQSGDLIYHGRVDQQLKINGHRIEPTAVIRVIEQCKGVTSALVRARMEEDKAIGLVCYYTGDATIELLRSFASTQLPLAMIPDTWIRLDEIPLTVNGKLDVSKLPQWNEENSSLAVRPETPIESMLADIFADVLNTPIGTNDNFFQKGGDSIMAIQICSRLYREGYALEVINIFEYPTIAQIAPILQPIQRIADQGKVVGEVELGAIQQAFFARDLKIPSHYNQSVMLMSKDRLNADKLCAVMERLMDHHDALRIYYPDFPKNTLQYNAQSWGPVKVDEKDLSKEISPERELEKQAQRLQSSLDLAKGPLIRIGLYHLPDGDRLLIIIHHLLVDGVSWRIFMEDFLLLWKSHKGDVGAVALPLKTDSFQAWTRHMKEYVWQGNLEAEWEYWQDIVTRTTSTDWLPKNNEQNGRFGSSDRLTFSLTPSESALLLKDVHSTYGTQINDILLAALGKSAFSMSDLASSVTVMLEGHGRESQWADVNINRTIGWFTTHYPVRLQAESESIERLIIETKEMLRRVPNKGIGYGLLHQRMMEKKPYVSPSQISFNYLGQFDTAFNDSVFDSAPESGGTIQALEDTRWYDVEWTCFVNNDCLTVELVFDPQQYDSATLQEWLNEFVYSIREIIDYCVQRKQHGSTPTDFSYNKLSVAELDKLFNYD
jgi:tyrocidine synthetase-3